MTRPNLYTDRKTSKVYSIHTYAKEHGVSKQAASKRLRKLVLNGSYRFRLRNKSQPIHQFMKAVSDLWDYIQGVYV